MLAPFYYKVGDSLANYIELNTNEVGALKPLEMPEDPDDLQASQDQQDQVDANKMSQEGDKGENIEEKPVDEDEPRIEDVKPDD